MQSDANEQLRALTADDITGFSLISAFFGDFGNIQLTNTEMNH